MILSQMVEAARLGELTPEDLREMILNLNKQIEAFEGDELEVSIEANIVGRGERMVHGSRPFAIAEAGPNAPFAEDDRQQKSK